MDKRRRSIVKGVTWRVLATLDTIFLAFIFTGSIRTAFSIAGLEIITKVIWYYAHERVWSYLPTKYRAYRGVALVLGHDTHMHSVLKAVSWRFLGSVDTFLISLLVTRQLSVSGYIGGAELVTKIVLYYLHERIWLYVPWGKIPLEPSPEDAEPRDSS